MAKLADNRYGKFRVRLVKVKRTPDRHEMHEWSVDTTLTGAFETAFTEGDNGSILPTDTMKNIVYSRAKESSADCIEAFGLELADFFLDRNPQVDSIQVEITEIIWNRVTSEGAPHPTTFKLSGPEQHKTTVTRRREQPAGVTSGVEHLVILKTTKSGFVGFIKDPWTTLPETTDRIFATEACIHWTYSLPNLDFKAERTQLLETLLSTFAEHDSLSVQQTLFAMGEAALDSTASIDRIHLALPNRHCLLVNLAPFGQENPNEIFVPTDEPHGYIEATIVRD